MRGFIIIDFYIIGLKFGKAVISFNKFRGVISPVKFETVAVRCHAAAFGIRGDRDFNGQIADLPESYLTGPVVRGGCSRDKIQEYNDKSRDEAVVHHGKRSINKYNFNIRNLLTFTPVQAKIR
jgi:hypothetical protein